jgi:Holliday junction resolvase RusA-like endonuclease
MILRIDGIPPSWNKIMRMNQYEQNNEAKRWHQIVYLCAKRQNIQEKFTGKRRVVLEYHFDTAYRHDPDNYSGKFIMDGLVKAGILEDDDFRHIELLVRAGKICRDDPHVLVHIEDLEGIA